MSRVVWPIQLEKPAEYILCECDQPDNVTFIRNTEEEAVFKCKHCGRTETYVRTGGTIKDGIFTAELRNPSHKKVNTRRATRLSWGTYVPNFARSETRDGEDQRDWFRRMMA